MAFDDRVDSPAVIQLLINEYPDAVKEKDRSGNLPLYQACHSKCFEPVIPLIMESFPEALLHKSPFKYPLEIAYEAKLSDWIILMLFHGNPDAACNNDSVSNYIKQVRHKNYEWLLQNMDKSIQ